MKLDLRKLDEGTKALKLNLTKAGIVTPPEAEVAFDMDVSGSFDDEHREGLTQGLLQRLVPWAEVLDPDKKLDMFTFSNGDSHANHVGEVTRANLENYVARNIIGRVAGYNGGTDYSYVIRKNLEHFGWLPKVEKKGGGWFSKPKTVTTQGPQRRSLVLFITDGDNGDKSETMRLLEESQKRGDQVYFQFIGISNQGGSFPFLQKIADKFDNTGLVVVNDFNGFINKSDDELNATMLTGELLAWLKK